MLPSADDGARLRAPAGTGWQVTVEEARLGKVRYWVVAERLPAGELTAAAESRKRWQAAGHEVSIFEGGALVGIAGRTLDTRSLSIAVDPQPTREAAEAAAETLEAKQAILGEVVAESVERPGGWIVAREERSGVEIRARDLLWISPTPGQSVDVADVEFGRGTAHSGKADRRYAGDLYLAIGNDGLLAVVNVASAETPVPVLPLRFRVRRVDCSLPYTQGAESSSPLGTRPDSAFLPDPSGSSAHSPHTHTNTPVPHPTGSDPSPSTARYLDHNLCIRNGQAWYPCHTILPQIRTARQNQQPCH
jgi:hypothetical protein